ncbi:MULTISPECIES: DUF3068 domain-containing protein [Micromonospora]|uniref:DUF3068 domain-containing protein n=1 Tax=Micromonospora sicca TaxID=2202420 RepID=A0A317D975_9ACTN|nr:MULTISPECIES: DUF3068 domain-containing protein [unclassified Micromonospora]MBM0225566.1 DUF3068 domain-containing protein [Micromonospora sp. ATA51]PWR11094.1 DUF3068 domain-containing protein [Micromonospora sp. 4G51]
MKHRALGAVLFGVGVLLLALAAGLVFVVTPALAKLPYDLDSSTSVAEASNAKFLQINDGSIKINDGDLRSTVLVTQLPKETANLTGDLDGKAVVWRVGQTVERVDNKQLVSAYGAQLALDRVSGAALEWNGQWLDDTGQQDKGIKFAGQIYKFPFHTEKKDYRIFDRDLRRVRDAKFAGTENIKGIETYRFEQVITDEPLNLDSGRLTPLLATFAPGATDGKVVYSNQRTVWVDPVTGSFIKVREVQKKVLTPNVGAPTTLLDADFAYNEATITASADRAKDSRDSLRLLSVYVPVGLAVLGLVLLIGGVLVGRGAAAAAVGEARHRADVPTRVEEPVRGADAATDEQFEVDRQGGPLSDEIPPASTNWRAEEEPAVPAQRPATEDGAGKR